MRKNLFSKTINYLTNFIQAQLLITIISLPILASWGLPISKYSFLGNLIFTPFLGLFLIASSLIFFTQIFGIPNGFFIDILEVTTIIWEELIDIGNKDWLVGFTKPSIIVVLVVPIITFYFLFHKKINTSFKRILSLSIILVACLIYLNIQTMINTKVKDQLISRTGQFQITKEKDNRLEIVDNNFFGRKQSLEKYINFELKPYLLKNFGSININNITIKKPCSGSFKFAKEACKTFDIKSITLPYFDKKLTKYGWRCFFELKRYLEKNNIIFSRIKS